MSVFLEIEELRLQFDSIWCETVDKSGEKYERRDDILARKSEGRLSLLY